MSLDNFSTLMAVGTALAACMSGLGGLVKFRTWWNDRKLSMRIDSAQALMDKGSSDWQKSFGQTMFARAHFARLTGIDVPDGHAGLLALHERLGGSDAQFNVIRRAVARLDRRTSVASPRTMSRRDWIAVMSAAFFCFVFAALALAMVGLVTVVLDRFDWSQAVPVSKLMAIVVSGMYAAVSALFSASLFKEVDRHIAAHRIRQDLLRLEEHDSET